MQRSLQNCMAGHGAWVVSLSMPGQATLCKRDDECRRLEDSARAANKRRRTAWAAAKLKVTRAVGKVGGAKVQLESLGLKRGPGQRFFSARGGVRVAIRRALGNCAASAIGRVLAMSSSGCAVQKWELRAHAALQAAARADYADAEEQLRCDGGIPKVALRFPKTEATNKAICHKRELHACRVESHCAALPPDEAKAPGFLFACVAARGDLQVVPPHCTARVLYAWFSKHLGSVRAPLWTSVPKPGSAKQLLAY